MKKFFMVAVMAVAALSANAQLWIGGNLNYDTQKTAVEVEGVSSDKTSSNFTIAPEIGYNLNEKWAVAVALGYGYSNDLSIGDGEYKVSGSANSFSINPYVRYNYVKVGNFSAFLDGGIAFTSTHINGTTDYMENYKTFGVAVKPGISYAISPKVSLVAHIGKIGYEHDWTKIKTVVEPKYTKDSFVFNLTNSISFGAYVTL